MFVPYSTYNINLLIIVYYYRKYMTDQTIKTHLAQSIFWSYNFDSFFLYNTCIKTTKIYRKQTWNLFLFLVNVVWPAFLFPTWLSCHGANILLSSLSSHTERTVSTYIHTTSNWTDRERLTYIYIPTKESSLVLCCLLLPKYKTEVQFTMFRLHDLCIIIIFWRLGSRYIFSFW